MKKPKIDSDTVAKQMAQEAFATITKWLFSVLAISYSREIPAGYVLKGKINTPGDLPGYICLSVVSLIKYAWELV